MNDEAKDAPGTAPAQATAALGGMTHGQIVAHIIPDQAMNLTDRINILKEQQKRIKAEKKDIAKVLKNACKRRKRLKHKARQLTDADLLDVIQMRRDSGPGADADRAVADAADAAGCVRPTCCSRPVRVTRDKWPGDRTQGRDDERKTRNPTERITYISV